MGQSQALQSPKVLKRDPDVNFEQLVNQIEDEEDEDWELPPELRRMVEQ